MYEKRRETRKKLKIPVRITLYKSVKKSEVWVQMECHTKDISMNGLGLVMQISSADVWEKLNSLTPDQKNTFFIDLDIHKPEKEIRLSGTIMWSKIIDFKNKDLQIGVFLKKMTSDIRQEWSSIVEKS